MRPAEAASFPSPPTGSPGRVTPEVLDTRLRRARRPALVTVPEQLRLGRLAVSTSAVVALLALVVAVGCAFTLRVLWAERGAVPEPVRAGTTAAPDSGVTVTRDGSSGATVGAGAAAGGAGPSAAASATTAGTDPARAALGAGSSLVVHVVGQVRKPGLVRLGPGARVADALAAAGGASRRADLAALNLARPVSDGEQVYVPRPGESPPATSGGGTGAASAAGGPARPGAGDAPAAGTASGPVDLNTADLGALDSLPGVGPVLAQRILEWRTEHGRFTSVDELGEVSGIGEKLLARLRPKVTL